MKNQKTVNPKALDQKTLHNMQATSAKIIAIVDYPKALQSAVFGLQEMFELASKLAIDANIKACQVQVVSLDNLPEIVDLVVLPPSLQADFSVPPTHLVAWLQRCYKEGAVLSSACSGVKFLAETQLFNGRKVTTHWGLATTFADKFPAMIFDSEKILINDGDLITAGGLMSWLDLGLEIVAIFYSPSIMRALGKQLVVDTGYREQRYYQCFKGNLSHTDEVILRLQKHLQLSYAESTNINLMAKFCLLSERTFLRRFVKATAFKPTQYLQRLRVQEACDLLENTQQSFESITFAVGYESVSAFRKVFVQIIGITPLEFRQRFVKN
jgi:transcriptional regulator GlxA family with amidase domain